MINDSLIILPELEVSLSLSVNYDKNADDYKWNNFGFPLNKWEYADLSAIYTTSAINFKIRGSKVPKMQVNLGSYMGKIKRINNYRFLNLFQIICFCILHLNLPYCPLG